MEIERINEDTIKFYISYLDLEERGFNQEDVWYDREKSEELFWDMMDELKYEEEFSPEGPLWIQVQALKHGLEVFVTKKLQLVEKAKMASMSRLARQMSLQKKKSKNYSKKTSIQ